MEFHQLKGLAALAEAKSFTRAAQMTHVVQSTLSQQIRSLEEELGMQLVTRTTRRVELTAAGKTAVEYAKKLLKLREEFICEMRKETEQQSGVIRSRWWQITTLWRCWRAFGQCIRISR